MPSVLQPGVTTDEIDKAVHKMIIENGAYPSPLTYGNPHVLSNYHTALHLVKYQLAHSF
jgi:methionine aminopeptidase